MGVLDEMKEIGDLIKKAGDIDLYRRIVKLEGEVIDLTRDKRRADEKIEELERNLNMQKELVFRKPFFYLGGDPAPFCPGCWDAKKKAIHLVNRHVSGFGMQMVCPVCSNHYDEQ